MVPLRRVVLATVVALAVSACVAPAPEPDPAQLPVVVRTSGQLVEALHPVNAGRRILVARGEYRVDRPLQVPDGATLEGEGVMTFDENGLPAGFKPGSATVLRVVAGFHGQVLTLGDGSGLRGLRVLDLANLPSQPSLRQGNVVQVASRAPGDAVAASIVECEIVNPNLVGYSDVGPHGHGVVALTLNPNLGAPPAAHEGARVSVRVQRSVVRTHTGAVVFANNFAARGDVTVTLEGNRFEGFLIIGAGVSRPDMVTDAVMRIESRDNRYLRSGRDRYGWLMLGGSTSPHFLEAGISGAARNTLRVDSTDDRIEGFRQGIEAAAARRIGGQSSLLMDNRVELQLRGTRIRTDGEGAADFVLQGTMSQVAQAEGLGEFPAGDRNILRVVMAHVLGSGERRNVYADVAGPAKPENQGVGNRLEFSGDGASFGRSNRGIDPSPEPRFFVGFP
jgi:hypothetical protein